MKIVWSPLSQEKIIEFADYIAKDSLTNDIIQNKA